jgi:hypothetical protein
LIDPQGAEEGRAPGSFPISFFLETGSEMTENRPVNLRETVKSTLLFSYLLRIQILGFLFLWPFSGWLFRNAMFRGLTDLSPSQIGWLALFSLLFVLLLVTSTNIVLLWGRLRVQDKEPDYGNKAPKARARWIVVCLGAIALILFLQNAVAQWSWGAFGGVVLAVFAGMSFLVFDWMLAPTVSHEGRTYKNLITLPISVPSPLSLPSDGNAQGVASEVVGILGPGYGGPHGQPRLGHGFALALFLYVVLAFYPL